MVKKIYVKNILKSQSIVTGFWYTLKKLNPIINMLFVIY